jgi:DUF4097 and DUF4098 domain-containing protein YvlB
MFQQRCPEEEMLIRRNLVALSIVVLAVTALPVWASHREEFHKSVPLEVNGDFSIKNVNGDIKIAGWDRNEVQIDAVKSADSEEKLHEVRIQVFGSGHSVEVKTKYPDQSNNSARIEYTIHLPWGVRVFDAETVNGSVHIDGPRGRIRAETVNGKVEVWNAADAVELKSVNGDVAVALKSAGKEHVMLKTVNGNASIAVPQSTNAHMKADTVNGQIHSDLPVNVNRPKYGPGASVDSNLGSGGATIELETVNGSIYLRKS